jgi:hypothetical protein
MGRIRENTLSDAEYSRNTSSTVPNLVHNHPRDSAMSGLVGSSAVYGAARGFRLLWTWSLLGLDIDHDFGHH